MNDDTHEILSYSGTDPEDYGAIAKHSQEMSLLSHAAQWQVLQTVEYVRHSAEFRRTTDALTQAGKAKNLDGATLAYFQVTLSCVNCHKYVRSTRIARSDQDLIVPTAR